jgi:hypothetical protein
MRSPYPTYPTCTEPNKSQTGGRLKPANSGKRPNDDGDGDENLFENCSKNDGGNEKEGEQMNRKRRRKVDVADDDDDEAHTVKDASIANASSTDIGVGGSSGALKRPSPASSHNSATAKKTSNVVNGDRNGERKRKCDVPTSKSSSSGGRFHMEFSHFSISHFHVVDTLGLQTCLARKCHCKEGEI